MFTLDFVHLNCRNVLVGPCWVVATLFTFHDPRLTFHRLYAAISWPLLWSPTSCLALLHLLHLLHLLSLRSGNVPIKAFLDGIKENPATCVKHRPLNFLTVKTRNDGDRLVDPLSVFKGFDQSENPIPHLPSPPSSPTKRAAYEIRSSDAYQLKEFEEIGLKFEELKSSIRFREFSIPEISVVIGDEVCI